MPLTVEQDAAEKIRAANHKVLQVCHVASAGDSGEGKDIVLYLAPDNVRMTARLWVELKKSAGMAGRVQRLQHVSVDEGWD